MRRNFLISLLLLINISLFSQDTITVQTLTFDSITARRGVWQFPEDQDFRKILMEYTLKCDFATTQDAYQCGEWDYLTYSTIFEKTGLFDSNTYYQPSFTYINNNTVDSLFYQNEPTYTYYRNINYQNNAVDTLELNNIEIGESNSWNEEIFNTMESDGRSQFIWKASELVDLGFEAGEITGIKIKFMDGGVLFDQFKIRYAEVNENEYTSIKPMDDLTTIYNNSVVTYSNGFYDFNFYQPIIWDGSSNILIDFSFSNPEGGNTTSIEVSETELNSGIFTNATENALNLDGKMDFVKLESSVFSNSEITLESWVYIRSHNNWNRLIDFGNGAGQDNILFALSKGTSGKPYFSIRNDDDNYQLQAPYALPLNEWVHIALTINSSNLAMIFVNGQVVVGGYMPFPNEVERNISYIGKSNWSNDKYVDIILDEFRIYSYGKSIEEVPLLMNKRIENPATEENLIMYYDFNNMEGLEVDDLSNNSIDGKLYGYPNYLKTPGSDLFLDFNLTNKRPNIIFEKLVSTEMILDSTIILNPIENAKDQIIIYDNIENPTQSTDTISLWTGKQGFVYDNGMIVDTVDYEADQLMIKENLVYYGDPYELTNNFELARYITPYGINLSLGDGFTWIYDVTDYAHLLKGEVDFKSGNQQELIDVKFKMITGTPPRDVIKLDTIWGHRRSYRYNYLGGDSSIMPRDIELEEDAKMFKVISRITGHGHNSNDGSYPHCCEWKDNTHYLYVNNNEAANWHIWQTDDCALNPVFPQGGTWNGSREGWCPGDVVKDFEFEITNFVEGNTVNVDYGITDVPDNNLGMGWGNYVITKYLVQYDAPNFENDVEVYDVISPNDWEYYSRKNPICKDPSIIVRNNGTELVTNMNITYGVSGGESFTFTWEGNIEPMHKEEISLPAMGDFFWLGDGTNKFTVTVNQPNGNLDEYSANDSYSTHYDMPDQFDGKIIIEYRTNNQPERYFLQIMDGNNDVVLEKDDLDPNTMYYDTLDLVNGCYHLELTDTENMGLSYWAYPGQGTGYFRITNIEGDVIKYFDGDFGHMINYAFGIGGSMYIDEPVPDGIFEVYPSPASTSIDIRLDHVIGDFDLLIYNMSGSLIYNEFIAVDDIFTKKMDVTNWTSGVYLICIQHKAGVLKQKIVIE